MLAAMVYGHQPKGKVRVRVEDNALLGPVVTEVKGLRGGVEWIANAIQAALVYDSSGYLTVRWEEADIPASLRKHIVVSQSM